MTGYEALHETAAWLDLSDRGKIRVTGRDRVRYLHNMLSNDVKSLAPGQSNYHFLLNAQGRIQADANLFVFPEWMLIDCEPELTERILQHLKRYIIADQVQLEDVTASLATIAIEGAQVPAEVGLKARDLLAAPCSATGQPGLWMFVEQDRLASVDWGLAATPAEARIVRVENGIPRYGEDFGETTLPQETQQTRALCFTKGCYLGQEIVERIRARGQVNKLLVQVGVDGEPPPSPGATILAGGQEVGRLTSPVYSPRLGQSVGLAILRREFAAPGTELTVEGRASRVLR
jgi:aminomethyltransferase